VLYHVLQESSGAAVPWCDANGVQSALVKDRWLEHYCFRASPCSCEKNI